MSVALETDPGAAREAPQDPNQIIHDWFLNIVSEYPEKDLANTIGADRSKFWKLKKGQQRLSAVELVILHQSLNVPLPRLVPGGTATPAPAPRAQPADDKALIDYAYHQVNQIEAGKPPEERANQFEKLELMFHILKTVRETPEAIELKDL